MSREGALWIGGLERYMDEEFLMNAFREVGEMNVVSVKVIKHKITGEPASYGFVNFDSDPSALLAMHKLNGKIIPNTQPPVRFKLNHNNTRLLPGEKDFSIWVGDLTPEVDDLELYKFFTTRFHTVKYAKVIIDPTTGSSKGFGFVRFGDEDEQSNALISMMGVSGLGGRPIRVSLAVNKSKLEGGGAPSFFPSSLTGSTSSGSKSGSITDTLSASALAAVVSNASGNPNAGAAVMAEVQSQEYQKYWTQYTQNYWAQYAAWEQYAQYEQAHQYQEYSEPVPEEPLVSFATGDAIFEGNELQLVEHTFKLDLDDENDSYLIKSEDLWEEIMDSFWWRPTSLGVSNSSTCDQEKK